MFWHLFGDSNAKSGDSDGWSEGSAARFDSDVKAHSLKDPGTRSGHDEADRDGGGDHKVTVISVMRTIVMTTMLTIMLMIMMTMVEIMMG